MPWGSTAKSTTHSFTTQSRPVYGGSAVTSPTLPGATSISGHSLAGNWTNANNILTDDGTYAQVNFLNGTPSDGIIQLATAPTDLLGNNKAVAGVWPTSFAIATYGGAADTWGASLTYGLVNSSDFGVSIVALENESLGSDYLFAGDFNFNLPPSIIDGITVEIERMRSGDQGRIDFVRMTVDYTPTDVFNPNWGSQNKSFDYDFLLMEDSSFLLLENGDRIILDQNDASTWTTQNKS